MAEPPDPVGSKPIRRGPRRMNTLDAPVVQEDQQPVPLVGDIGQLLPKPGLGRDERALLGEPQAEGVHQRRGLGPADELARRRRLRPGSSSRWHRAARCGPVRPSRSANRCCRTPSRGPAWHGPSMPPASALLPAAPAGRAGCGRHSRRPAPFPRSPRAASRHACRCARAHTHTPRPAGPPRTMTAHRAPSSTGSRSSSCPGPGRGPEPWSRPDPDCSTSSAPPSGGHTRGRGGTTPCRPSRPVSSGPAPAPSGRRSGSGDRGGYGQRISRSGHGRWRLRSAARPRSDGPAPAPG